MANPDDSSLRILCIEDDPALQKLLKLSLTRYGFEVMGYEGQIVVMSGRLSTAELHEYAPYAISGFFHKPFEIGLMATMLRRQIY